GSTPPAPRPRVRRSRVTNGTAVHVDGNGNSAWTRRFVDLCASHVSDLGGPDNGLSEAQLSLVRRCATIECELEAMEGRLSRGEAVDLDVYGRLAGHLRRAFETLGIHRVAKQGKTLGEVWLEAEREREAARAAQVKGGDDANGKAG